MKKYIWITWMLALGLVPGIQGKNSGHGEEHEKKDHGKSSNEHKKDDGKDKDEQQKEKKGRDKHESHQKNHEDGKGDRDLRITSAERQTFHEYVLVYQKNRKVKKLPPGLAKKVARGEELPPGWQKKIARGEVAPMLVYQRVEPIPRVLFLKLPEQPVGTHLGVIDERIVRFSDATRTILDVIDLR